MYRHPVVDKHPLYACPVLYGHPVYGCTGDMLVTAWYSVVILRTVIITSVIITVINITAGLRYMN